MLSITSLVVTVVLSLIFTKAHSVHLGIGTNFNEDDDLVVELTNPVGKIRGHILQSDIGNFYAFQDVPYAQSTTGNNRFKPPKALGSWDEILNATSNQKICPQMPSTNPKIIDGLYETEDCLVLNIYSPVKPGSNASLPVYFWIHGGSFYRFHGGITIFNPKYFVNNDIVVVTINYRLGPLGFLTLNDENIPGNLGLKDQHLALKWVSENIHLFGGDPTNIVIGGESAGGISVGYQLLSKLNAGLIKAAIQQSGSSLNTFGFQIGYRDRAFEFGRRINSSFNSNDNSKLLELLQSVPLSEILRAESEFRSNERIGFMKGEYWKPVVENGNDPNALVTGPMREDFENGNFNLVPVLMGFNSEESLRFLAEVSDDDYVQFSKMFDANPVLMISDKLNVLQKNKRVAGQEVKAIYTDTTFSNNKTAFVRYCSDAGYTRPLLRQAQLTSPFVPVYLYEFSYSTEVNDIPGAGQVGHAEDLAYFWDTPINRPAVVNETIRKSLLKLWSNFIKEQNPTPVVDDDLQNITWPPTTPATLQYLNINETFSIETSPPRQYEEVKNVLDKYIQRPFNIY